MKGITAKTKSWVTTAGNDVEALQALILVRSLKRCYTAGNITTVVSDNVSGILRYLLEQECDLVTRESGNQQLNGWIISRLPLVYNCWKLKVWEGCVYIAPNSLVLGNCDELFEEDDKCNNVITDTFFKFKPCLETYWKLLQIHREEQMLVASDDDDHDGLKSNLQELVLAKFFGKYVSEGDGKKNVINKELPNLCENENSKIVYFQNLPWSSESPKAAQELWMQNYLELCTSLDNSHVSGLTDQFVTLVKQFGVCTNDVGLSSTHLSIGPQLNEEEFKDSIAIVGMSCRFPDADSPNEFWEMLVKGHDAIQFPPELRKSSGSKEASDKDLFQCGYLKCPVDEFDAKFIGISPREVEFIDPQQRLLLEVTWEALENAGIDPLSLKGTRTSAFVGIYMQEYLNIIKPIGPQESHHSYLGNAFCATASRISYFLGLIGPNISVESGCSSSLVSVHLACSSLLAGETSLALASGVNLILVDMNKKADTYAMMPVLSQDSRCKTFDASANGFARGEGCGTVVLKRFADAKRDADNILAVIRGSAMNNDGSGYSFGTPNATSQEEVYRKALNVSNVDPCEIGYVECHGTGTAVGDPTEFNALQRVYSNSNRLEPLYISSVKTNIGHTESEAGIAGLIKTILCLQNQALPPHLHLKNLNPKIHLESIPAVIPTQLTKLDCNNKKQRLAAVSSFSMSGTNAQVILQEYPSRPNSGSAELGSYLKSTALLKRNAQLITLSAKSQSSLNALAKKYLEFIRNTCSNQQQSAFTLEDVAFTTNSCRSHFQHRVGFVASNFEELATSLEQCTFPDSKGSSGKAKIGFLFTGQGSQYLGMGKVLYEASVPFWQTLDNCDQLFVRNLGVSLKEVLWSSGEDDKPNYYLQKSIFCQPAIFCIEYALTQHWKHLGIVPDAVLGHSIGEFGAAVCAGVLSLEEGFNLVVERSRLVESLAMGSMLVMKTNTDNAKKLISNFVCENASSCWVDIAAVNSSSEIVVSSMPGTIAELEIYCKTQQVRTLKVSASHAFHSRAMDPILNQFESAVTSILKPVKEEVAAARRNPTCTYISGTRAEIIEHGSGFGPSYWVDHLRNTVQFSEASQIISDKCNIFIEIGPHPILLGLTMAKLDSAPTNKLFCPSMKSGQDDWTLQLTSISKLYCSSASGVEIRWKSLYTGRSVRKIGSTIPNYAFDKHKYWFHDEELSKKQIVSTKSIHPILGRQIFNPLNQLIFTQCLSTKRLKYLQHHRIGKKVIFPGAGFLENSLAVAKELMNGHVNVPIGIQDLVIEAALLVEPSVQVQTIAKLRIGTGTGRDTEFAEADNNSKGGEYEISFHAMSDIEKWKRHAKAVFKPGNSVGPIPGRVNLGQLQTQLEFRNAKCLQKMYTEIASLGIEFGRNFQSISCAWISDDEILAQIPIPELGQEEYVCHPIVLDAMIQIFACRNAIRGWPSETGKSHCLELPVGIQNFVWMGKPLSSVLYAHCTAGSSFEAGGTGDEFGSVLLLNEDGSVVAFMSGLELVKIRVESFLRNLVADEMPGFYIQKWVPVSAARISPSKATEQPSWLIFNSSRETPGIVLALKEKLEFLKKSVLIISNDVGSPKVNSQGEADNFAIDFTNLAQFKHLPPINYQSELQSMWKEFCIFVLHKEKTAMIMII